MARSNVKWAEKNKKKKIKVSYSTGRLKGDNEELQLRVYFNKHELYEKRSNESSIISQLPFSIKGRHENNT